ncbi:hypothetical protein [Nocardia sp. NPDC051570]|uniref:hypothetical protein n=1 Tax=Nocardia sp. NPDC051570 TaxID=3364324 RepID=UPI00379AD3BF
MTVSTKLPARRVLARIIVTGSLAVLPMGVFVAPVLAAPLTLVDDNGWQQDCDHSGQFSWQQNRGQWQMGDCDGGRGHWEQHGNGGQWQWHHDRDYSPPPPAPMSPFGSG